MKTSLNTNICLSLFMIVVVLLTTSSTLNAQPNKLKVTPLNPIFGNIDLGYERMLKNDWSVGTNFQFWFQDKTFSLFSFSDKVRVVNKGIRYSFEFKRYVFAHENKRNKVYATLGISTFMGKHFVKERVIRRGIFNTNNNQSYQKYETTVLSTGVGFHMGVRILYPSGNFINLGLIGRGSWADKKDIEFRKIIDGAFLEPQFQLGCSF